MKITICDDSPFDVEAIFNLIENENLCIDEYKCELLYSGTDLLNKYKNGFRTDILFLDIEMPDSSGIDTAKVIREYDKNVIIIFISSHSELVFDTFDCETFNFVTKPINKEKFSNVINMAVLKYKRNNAYFVITKAHESIKLPIDKIKYAECYKKHMIFYTFEGTYEMRITLSETLAKLNQYGFIQTHQGYLVNMNLIKRFDGYDIILKDGTKVMMSARKKAEVLLAYSEFVERWK